MEAGPSIARLVGRVDELERLGAALEAAAAGRGSAVLVAGDAGIGKTRLVSELAERARLAGALVLGGRCIDLVGAGLPFLPFAEALRPVGGLPSVAPDDPDAQLRLFQDVLAVLGDAAATAPLVLVLEDLHWADGSTVDLVTFLAHAVRDLRILVVATYRSDELRPGDALRAAASATVELEPLTRDDVETLLEAIARERVPAELTEAIFARSEGNPFFAEELYALAVRGDEKLPHALRDALLRRFARLDTRTRSVIRLAAAAGRDVPYRLLAAVTGPPEGELVAALHEAVEGDVLEPDQDGSTFRFRHALLAEAVYATLLPGEREDVHRRLAVALAADPTLVGDRSVAGELAHHWTAAGRPAEALAASVEAAREDERVSGLAEALRHLEHALGLWERVAAAEELAGARLDEILGWAAELADLTGDAPRALQLARRAIELVDDPVRSGLLHERLGHYLMVVGDHEAGVAAFRHAVNLVPAEVPSSERARVVASLGNALMFYRAHEESLKVSEEAIAIADAAGDERPALRAHTIVGIDLCRLGRLDEGIERMADARRRAEEHGTPRDLTFNYIMLCDVLIAAGRLHDAARTALEALGVARRLGLERGHGVGLAVNAATALVGTGDWDRAQDVLATAFRLGGAFWPHHPHLLQAEIEISRGAFDSARTHLEAATGARQPVAIARRAELLAELALWEGRPDAAAAAVADGLRAGVRDERPRLSALGVRAHADRAQLARAWREDAVAEEARRTGAQLAEDLLRGVQASPAADAWDAVAQAELARLRGDPAPRLWQLAVKAWDALDRPYPAAYCRWRLAESLPPHDAATPARAAHRVARLLGARPLQRQLELFAQRTRIDLDVSDVGTPDAAAALAEALGVTAREAEVLELVARGYTNREIGAALHVTVKTASVHVSHILRKLGAQNRVEAAAIAQRVIAGPSR